MPQDLTDDTGLVNGLVLSGNEPLPESMLTNGESELKSQKTHHTSPSNVGYKMPIISFVRKLTIL